MRRNKSWSKSSLRNFVRLAYLYSYSLWLAFRTHFNLYISDKDFFLSIKNYYHY